MAYGDKLDPKRDHKVKINSTAYTFGPEYRMVSTWIDTDNECWGEPWDPLEMGYAEMTVNPSIKQSF